jgi:hypothetical protein
LFTIGKAENIWSAPDYRDYGGFYWHQNTRQTYWSMLASGDYELMAPFFDFYARTLPLLRERTNVRKTPSWPRSWASSRPSAGSVSRNWAGP